MQGFPLQEPLLQSALVGLSDADVLLGAGNAMSVPVVGAVLADVLTKAEFRPLPRLSASISEVVPAIEIEDSLESLEETSSAIEYALAPVCKKARIGLAVNIDCDHDDFHGKPQSAVPSSSSRPWLFLQSLDAARGSCQQGCNSMENVPLSRFPCGCWLHLVNIRKDSSRASVIPEVLHVQANPFFVGRDHTKVAPPGLLLDNSVSRLHAELRACAISNGNPASSNGCVAYLSDRGSSNGTQILGRGQATVGETIALKPDDIVAFGTGLSSDDSGCVFRIDVVRGQSP